MGTLMVVAGVLVGLAVLVAFAFVYTAFRRALTRRFWVSTVDEHGKRQTDRRGIPESDIFARDGVRHVGAYVKRLAQSKATYASVTITTPNCLRGFALARCSGSFIFTFHVDWPKRREKAIRDLFDRQGIRPSQDYARRLLLFKVGRVLVYAISDDSPAVTDLCTRALRDGCDIAEHGALTFMVFEDFSLPQATG